MPDSPLTGDVVICSEAFNSAPANSVHLATVGGASPTWKSFASDDLQEVQTQNTFLSFDGSNQNLVIPTSTSLMQNDFTVSVRVKYPAGPTDSDGAFLDNNYLTAGTFGWRVYFDSMSTSNTGNLSVWVKNASGQYDNPMGTVSVDLGVDQWSHIMWGRASGSHFLYVNGSEITVSQGATNQFDSSTANFTPAGSDLRLFILNGGSVTQTPAGYADDLAIWSSDQSANVSTIYNDGGVSNISSQSTDGHWKMGDDSSDNFANGDAVSLVTDSSGNGNHAVQTVEADRPTAQVVDL